MPAGEKQRSWYSIPLFEGMGTLLLTYFAITGSQEAIAISLAFFTCYLLFAPISRGHFNPCVTLGVWLGEMAEGDSVDDKGNKIEKDWTRDTVDFITRLISQMVGGVAGVFLAYLCLARHRAEGTFGVAQVFITKLCPKDPAQPDHCETTGNQQLQMIGLQAFLGFVFVLAFIVIRKKGIRPSEDEIVQAVAIALVFFGLTHVGNSSGGSFNPVLSGALILFEYIASPSGTGGLFTYLPAYIIGPFLGAIMSALFFCCINCMGLQQEQEEKPAQDCIKDQNVQNK